MKETQLTIAAHLKEINKAMDRLKGIAHKTPVMTSHTLNERLNAQIFFKCENFQRIGAFKFRGAYNAISQLPETAGVITHSSGNHAQAVALAAKLLGKHALIVMPKTAPDVKKKAVKGYGATIIECEPTIQSREETAAQLMQQYGYPLIHPYNNLQVIYGAATAAYELHQEMKKLDVIVTPVGGGGLLSGTALATKGILPSCKVFGIEPNNADDAYQSFHAGKIITTDAQPTIADGLLTSLGPITFSLIRNYVEDIITVSEETIIEAMMFFWERMKLVVEPSGAVALAGLLQRDSNFQHKRIGVIISGGNVDLTVFFDHLKKLIK